MTCGRTALSPSLKAVCTYVQSERGHMRLLQRDQSALRWKDSCNVSTVFELRPAMPC